MARSPANRTQPALIFPTIRVNRPHNAHAVLIFVASWVAFSVPALVISLARTLQDWSATDGRYDNPYFLAFGVVANIVAMCSMLVGGLLSAPHDALRLSSR